MPDSSNDNSAAQEARRVNNYELLDEIGSGGMSRVFRARRIDTGETVAVKVIRVENVAADYERRLRREPEVQQGLGHENIVRLIDWFRIRDEFFLVMEYVDGRSLAQIIYRESGPLPFERARAYFRQLLRAVNHLHSLGIIHRDIKPSNILVQSNDALKLADFGIAKFTWQQGETKTQKGLGTPEYMSPEQARGTQIDHRTDIYSLGITLFEMLTGRKPFARDEATPVAYVEVINDILSKPLPDPRQYQPAIPASAVRLLNRASAKDPGDRFQSVGEFLGALELVEEKDISPATVVVGDLPGVGRGMGAQAAPPPPPPAPPAADQRKVTPAYVPPDLREPEPARGSGRTAILVTLLILALGAAGYLAYNQFGGRGRYDLKPLSDTNAYEISESIAADFQDWSRQQNSEAIVTLYAEDSVDYLRLKDVSRRKIMDDIQKFNARISRTDQFDIKVRRASAVNDSTINTEWIINYQYQRNDGAILRGVTSNLLTLRWFDGDWLITRQAQNWIKREVLEAPKADTLGAEPVPDNSGVPPVQERPSDSVYGPIDTSRGNDLPDPVRTDTGRLGRSPRPDTFRPVTPPSTFPSRPR